MASLNSHDILNLTLLCKKQSKLVFQLRRGLFDIFDLPILDHCFINELGNLTTQETSQNWAKILHYGQPRLCLSSLTKYNALAAFAGFVLPILFSLPANGSASFSFCALMSTIAALSFHAWTSYRQRWLRDRVELFFQRPIVLELLHQIADSLCYLDALEVNYDSDTIKSVLFRLLDNDEQLQASELIGLTVALYSAFVANPDLALLVEHTFDATHASYTKPVNEIIQAPTATVSKTATEYEAAFSEKEQMSSDEEFDPSIIQQHELERALSEMSDGPDSIASDHQEEQPPASNWMDSITSDESDFEVDDLEAFLNGESSSADDSSVPDSGLQTSPLKAPTSN